MTNTDTGNTKSQPDVLDRLIEDRRKALPEADRLLDQEQRWGLALSGGGIRSSIFCYGLISALAKVKAFSRFDLMSTVSGGGYIGSMVGRLAQSAESAEALQDELGARGATSHHRSWLRANSRYLTPRGSRDRLFGVVTFLRNLAGVHLELGFLAVLLACALGFIDILVWYGMDYLIKVNPPLPFGFTPMQLWEWLSKWPTLWLALPVPLLWAIGAATCYWYMPTSGREHAEVDNASHKVTRQLALAMQTGIALVLLGGIDWVAWRLAKQPAHLFTLGVLFASILSVLRLALPMFQQNGSSSEFLRRRLPALLDLAGRFGLLVLAIFWTSLVHAFATFRVWDSQWNRVDFVGATWALAIPTIISLGWIALSGRNLEFLNRSSLHNFYRSRLSRTYLGAANLQRKQGSKVTEVHDKDDVPLKDYKPHVNGGPVHIINVCINQTYQREGLYNIDRQGDLMSLVGSGYYKVQGRQWLQLKAGALSTLGTWMAVSGAAAAPGMGSLTRPGIASVLTTLGMRLGYWWRTGDKDTQWSSIWLPKYKGLYSELLAKFAGTASNTQYLSDGGHSENTAVYPLLEARCELIVMADCGADPAYKFQDLENLIRRARIDMNVDIRFIRPPQGSDALFGSLDELASPSKTACLALARINYPDKNLPGVLVLVKPNLTPGLPEDIYNYSRDCEDFPQDSTADQFFDEAQWESYFSLGCHLGQGLDETRLRSLIAAVQSDSWVDARAKASLGDASATNVTGTTTAVPVDSETTDKKSRRPLRIPMKSAAAAGLGLGVIVSSASGLWVAFENVQVDSSAGSDQVLKPLYDAYGALPVSMDGGQLNDSVGRMAAQLLTTWQTLRAHDQEDLFLNNPEALDMLRMTYGLCMRMSDKLAVCNTLIKTFQCPSRPTDSRVTQNDGYWAREEPAKTARMNERRADTYCDTDELDSESQQVAAITLEQETPELPDVVASAPVFTSIAASAWPWAHFPSFSQQVAAYPITENGQASNNAPACKGITIFIQIYGPNGRDNVRALRSLWRAEGASVPPIEDVLDAARRQGRSAPTPYGMPTVIYHQEDAKACAEALPKLASQPEKSWDVVQLNKRFERSPGTIEVWLPPTAIAKDFPQ